MSALTGLKFVSAKRPLQAPPIVQRRNKLSHALWEQLELARAHAESRTFSPTRSRTVKDKETGLTTTMDIPKRVKQWWFVADNGKVCFQLRYGNKVMEFKKGMNSIEVASGEELLTVIQSVQKAIDSGELDSQIETVSASVRDRFKK
jgi:hypothetical protein